MTPCKCIEELIRDITRIGFMSKSEATERIQRYADERVEEYKKALLLALPKEKLVDWTDIGDATLVAKQSEAYGWTEAIRACREAIKKTEL